MAQLVPIREIRPGFVLKQALFTRQGIKLLPPGVKLSDALCDALRGSGEPAFVLAQSVDEIADADLRGDRRPARVVRAVSAGQRATTNYITAGGLLALERGQLIEQHHVDAISAGDLRPAAPIINAAGEITAAPEERKSVEPPRAWAIRHQELGRVRATMLKTADSIVAAKLPRWNALPTTMRTGVETVAVANSTLPGWLSDHQMQALRAERVDQVRRIYADLLRGLPTPLAPMQDIVSELISLYARHPRRFAGLALLTQRRADYLPDHAYTCTALAVAMAIQQQWSRWDVMQAGLAGLLADCGMMMVPEEIRRAERPLDEAEINRVRRHPTMSVLLLDAIRDLPDAISLAAYQHHEREDGTGYPCGQVIRKLHPISRLIAVADVFGGATAPRPHRHGLMPYSAMEFVVNNASAGKLDRAIARSLLRVCGLFPVSSWVRLSDNSIARVIGSHHEQIDRPIIQRWSDGKPGEVIDLTTTKPWELSVLEAIESPLLAAA